MLTSAHNHHTVTAFFEGVCPLYIVYIFAKSVTMAMSSRTCDTVSLLDVIVLCRCCVVFPPVNYTLGYHTEGV